MRTEEGPGIIERMIDASARRRSIVFLIAAGLTVWGLWSAQRSELDALPDLSDTQVIVATEWMGRSPTLIEDQITYPIVTTFLGAPGIKTVRGFTMFGMSFVYVVFKDGTDIYWARSRVVEYLAKAQGKLPEGVTPQMGPDATSVGWVYQYALVDESGKHNLQELRSLQDWSLRYWLQGLEGVAEVASVGGFEKEYQIQIDPDADEGAQRLGRLRSLPRCAAPTPRSAAASSRWPSTSTRSAGAATSPRRRTSSRPSSRPTCAAPRSGSSTSLT